MFKHEKQLFHPVAVERPNPQYAALLQEQLGGGNGELKAAMQYLSRASASRTRRSRTCFWISQQRNWDTWKWWPRPLICSTATM